MEDYEEDDEIVTTEDDNIFILEHEDVVYLYKYLEKEFISPEFHDPVIQLVRKFRKFLE